MKIDLHIHTKTGSDGNLSIEEVFKEAKKRNIDLMSITDHDSIDCQQRAVALAEEYGIAYITGVELNVTFQYPGSKPISLDFLGYRYDINDEALKSKLQLIREHRERRARQILEKLNAEFDKEKNGTSLISITPDLDKQAEIIAEYMLEYINGVECWHSRNDAKTTIHYIKFAKKHSLLMTGGSDCHQKPILMGTLDIPDYVAEQFR